jgi:hypothetical protein
MARELKRYVERGWVLINKLGSGNW